MVVTIVRIPPPLHKKAEHMLGLFHFESSGQPCNLAQANPDSYSDHRTFS